MSSKENTQQAALRTRRYTVIGEHSNAYSYRNSEMTISPGDVCIVRPGAPYENGDIVLITCHCYVSSRKHYHAKFYKLCYGKKWKFRLTTYKDARGGTYYREGEESIIIGPVECTIKKGEKAKRDEQPKQPKGEIVAVKSGFDWPLFGLHKYDVLGFERHRKLQPGSLIAIHDSEDSNAYMFARVCLVEGDTVRICNAIDEHYDIPASRIVGPAVGEIDHSECVQSKVEALRAKIEKLESDRDPWANTTRIAELEKQIYDLEHPVEEEEEEEFEWPDLINAKRFEIPDVKLSIGPDDQLIITE